jgi:hypothetical protein
MTSEPDRKWLAEAARAAVHEWRAYVHAVVSVVREPDRFARQWADGTRDALNPVYYLLNSAALFVPWLILWRHIATQPDETLPLWAQVLQQASVFFVSLSWVLPGHVALRLLGGQRPLRTTFALFAYVFGGPLLLVALVSIPVGMFAASPEVASRPPLAIVNWALLIIWLLVFVSYMVRVMAAAHRLTWWRGLLAIAIMHASWLTLHHWLGKYHPTWRQIL